jgi:peptide-methionine (S)-S-oxide reductase
VPRSRVRAARRRREGGVRLRRRAGTRSDLLEFFFAFHDPTTLNRQGHDLGTQYRSAIFVSSPEQRATAEGLIAELTAARAFQAPIVTQIEPLDRFYPAEGYHQGYYRQNPDQPYCQATIAPKMGKLRAKYRERLKPAVRSGA